MFAVEQGVLTKLPVTAECHGGSTQERRITIQDEQLRQTLNPGQANPVTAKVK
jgi:hypothetical protein